MICIAMPIDLEHLHATSISAKKQAPVDDYREIDVGFDIIERNAP
jgi:hypothetical protein